MKELDGIVPECETGQCLIPSLTPAAARALEIRDKLVRLHRLNIGTGILGIYAVTPDDLELLAIAEDELNPTDEGADHGDGPEMDTEC